MTVVYSKTPIIINRTQAETKKEKGELNLKLFNLLMNVAVGLVFGFSIFIALIGVGAIEVLHLLVAGFPLFGAAGAFLVLAFYLLKIKKETMITETLNFLKAYLQTPEGMHLAERIFREALVKNKVN